jgi:hypothetical protein
MISDKRGNLLNDLLNFSIIEKIIGICKYFSKKDKFTSVFVKLNFKKIIKDFIKSKGL